MTETAHKVKKIHVPQGGSRRFPCWEMLREQDWDCHQSAQLKLVCDMKVAALIFNYTLYLLVLSLVNDTLMH